MSTWTADDAGAMRRPVRLAVFGLAVVIGVGALTARLAQLQIIQGGEFAGIAARNGRVEQAIPSARGLIYDRSGIELVKNIPTYSVKVRPADLPLDRRELVVGRLGGLLGLEPADINTTIDANAGSRFDQVRIARDVPEDTARLIAEHADELPGVSVVV